MADHAPRDIGRSAAALGLVAIVGAALLAAVQLATADRIAAQERRVMLEQFGQILPASNYDNDLLADTLVIRDENHFPRGQDVVVYRARRAGEPVAVILDFRAVNGYSGDIRLLAGIRENGSLTGVRVVAHRETPGLGDAIEVERSNWIRGFDDRSLRQPVPSEWAVRKDGGAFDQFTGATITPRAVVDALRLALEYYAENGPALFTPAREAGNGPAESDA
jgi:electron transport complex protein RnfG